ncbi:MAG: GHKL domain-containing protein [Elusimicrobia bacterium]|nr:GHKL domain-containing protein [Elusimicrobiota bacterium]
MTWWPFYLSLLSAFLNAGIACLAYARGRQQGLYRTFSVLGFSFALWSIAYARLWPGSADPFWTKVLFSPLTWLPAASISFVWSYTGMPESQRRLRTAPLYLVGAVLLAALWTDRVSVDLFRWVFLLFLYPGLLACVGILFVHWRKAQDLQERNRRGYMFLAAAIAAVGGVTDFLPHYGILGLPSLANVSFTTYSLLVIMAISRHHLLDLAAALGRAAAAAASLLISLVLTCLTWLTQRFEGPIFANFFVLSLLLVAILPPLWERLNARVMRWVFARKHRGDVALADLEGGLEAAVGTAEIGRLAADAVAEAWGAETRCWWVRRALRGIEGLPSMPEELVRQLAGRPQVATVSGLKRQGDEFSVRLASRLEEHAAQAVVPIARDNELVAVLLLGPPAAGFFDLAAARWLERLARSMGRAVTHAELTAGLLRADRLAQLGTLAAGIAHEVRNPLSGILGAAQLLRLNLGAEKKEEFIRILETEVDRLNGTLTELLDYASARPQKARCDWARVWDRVHKLLRASFPLKLALETEGAPLELGISGAHLQQIVINLVKNAVRAAEKAPAPRVVLAVSKQDDRAILSVSDNGSGIPEDVLPRLFVPFMSASAGGTGLGLATVRRLAELYGGRAWAENRETGAIFLVELPLAEMVESGHE